MVSIIIDKQLYYYNLLTCSVQSSLCLLYYFTVLACFISPSASPLHLTPMLYITIGKPIVFLPPVSMLYDNISNVSLQPSNVFIMSIKHAFSLLLPIYALYLSTLAILLLNHLNRFSFIRQKISRNCV